ncbi:2Fe-2S iron-sulfur cluster-binding protein [Rhodococcus erythropolis]|uniref:2Fe-2S iron-sulfur cluster-binding protein n=1 Tax=Rhodococcus erythropolis TaxID=1833 RepID=UPI00366F2FDA
MAWRPSRVHVECFASIQAIDSTTTPFTAVWEPSGTSIQVPTDRILLETLCEKGIHIARSCESGTCTVRIVSGNADHRDAALSADRRATHDGSQSD